MNNNSIGFYAGNLSLQQNEIDYMFNSFNIHLAYYEFLQKHSDQINRLPIYSMPIFMSIDEKNIYISNQSLANSFKLFLDKNKKLDINIHSLYCEKIL